VRRDSELPSRGQSLTTGETSPTGRESSPTGWREIERELVCLFSSFGRNCVRDQDGEPFIEYVRSREPATDDTIYTAGINKLSLTFLARLLARRFGGVL
jgi:hypothetical protein